jgi:transposase
MHIDWEKVSIYIRTGYTDMRKQINTLAILVQQQFGMNPMNGNLYVFCGSNRHSIKVLYWDRTGFAMWTKKVEGGRFPWPLTESEVRQITHEEMKMLLAGIDFFHAHQEKKYDLVV